MTSPEGPDAPTIAHQWWSNLTLRRSGRQKAALAHMKRAGTPTEVLFEPEALRLIERLPRNPDRVATLAGVLACVVTDDSRPFARAIGRASLDEDDSALVSEARFRRTLQTPATDLMEAMRRLVRMNKGQANVRDLSTTILFWGDRVKRSWMFQYYNVRAGHPEE